MRAAGKHPVQIICVVTSRCSGRGRQGRADLQAALARARRLLRAAAVAFATRAPWIFTAIWKLVAPFLAADTKAKVRILGKADDHLKALQEFIDFDQIPDFLGGLLGDLGRRRARPAEELDEVAPAPTTDEVVEQFRADEQQLPTNIE